MVRPCQRISTSMSLGQASSGAMRWTSTVSPFLSGDTTLETMYLASVSAVYEPLTKYFTLASRIHVELLRRR